AVNNKLLVRPRPGKAPIDDINWFARPVPNPDGHWMVAYAMHDLNYLYDLTTGRRIRIPDKSDAVATPDGKYMTVPGEYTSDNYPRFYDNTVLLEHLERGADGSGVEPVFIHEHDGLKNSFYQSLGTLESTPNTDVYRMIFSGTGNEFGFRMVDYRFETSDGALTVTASQPIPLCPEIENDLMTPFVSKDGQYVAAYTSSVSGWEYANDASLKIYQISDVNYDQGLAACKEVVDFGFPAGKADFSFDGNSLTFHISNVSYLAVFISSGDVYGDSDDPSILNTDVMVANLTRDEEGVINGVSGVRRLTTTKDIGAGSYFPAFFPDGMLFYIIHPLTKPGNEPRFEFQVVDPNLGYFNKNLYDHANTVNAAQEIGNLWTSSCLGTDDHDYAPHELPFFVYSLSVEQCRSLVDDADSIAAGKRSKLAATCEAILN
ncbi:MAG: hypothetical protein P8M18_12590, partial [Woeseiaceae bacterium]|nr:hypothetical protein [Woeseiaceae bacterium]